MKTKIAILTLMAMALSTSLSLAQLSSPQDVGLIPRSPTFDVNTNHNNGGTESIGVQIAANTNVLIGWEDDFSASIAPEAMFDTEAVWSMYDANGNRVTPSTTLTDWSGTNTVAVALYRDFYRDNGTPAAGNCSWGPKIHANLFGNGIGMGGNAGVNATSGDGYPYGIGLEIARLFATANDNNNSFADFGSFPGVQLLNNDGTKAANALAGATDANAEPAGSIRIGDWEYLANGNIVIVGESRQNADWVLTGQTAGKTIVYRIVSPSGVEVKSYAAVSSEPIGANMWNGVGVTANGFAVRWNNDGGGNSVRVRLFDNNGTPLGTNIDLSALTGQNQGGDRGDSTGFHGNGNDAYVNVSSINAGLGNTPWVTVLNADGTLRYSHSIGTNQNGDVPLTGRVDAGIAADGRVLVVFDDSVASGLQLPQGRLLSPSGANIGQICWISERDNGTNAVGFGRNPRAAWRGNQVAVIWESANSPAITDRVVAGRIFDVGPSCDTVPLSAAKAGITNIVPDKALWYSSANVYSNTTLNPATQIPNLDNWEPYASVLGNSTFLVEANTFADDGVQSNQRYTVALQPVGGGTAKIGEAFYSDAGSPYRSTINNRRENGNPGRVAGDRRPGAVNFIAGGESSPDGFAAFTSDSRWTAGTTAGLYDGFNTYGAVQTYSLNTSTLVQTPLHKAFDAVNGRMTTTYLGNLGEVTRFGGGLTVLDNGNSVVLLDDRTTYLSPNRTATLVIIGPTGTVVKDSFAIDPTISNQCWDNITAYKGGFCIRFNATLYFYDNAGNLKGSTPQSTSGVAFDGGRGDGTRIASHIYSPYVYLAGSVAEGTNSRVRLAVWDSRTFAFIKQTAVSTCYDPNSGQNGADRVNLAVDACDRVCVAYAVNPNPTDFAFRQIAARVVQFNALASTFTFLSPEFFPFVNHDRVGDPGNFGLNQTIQTFTPTVAMTTKEICIAGKGSINSTNNPSAGANSASQTTVYTVISHPVPLADPTPPVLSIVQSGGNVVISWALNTCDYFVQTATTVNGLYTNLSPQPTVSIVGATKQVTIPIGGSQLYVRLVR